MRIALFDNQRDNTPKILDVGWDDLRAELLRVERTPCDPCPGHTCVAKFGKAWSPAVYAPGDVRANKNVRGVSLAVFDLDNYPTEKLPDLAKRIDPYTYAFHSTHSPGSYRLVIPLTRSVSAAEWPRFQAAAGQMLDLPWDPQTKDPSRIYFFPSRAAGGAAPITESNEGAALDVDAILSAVSQTAAAKQQEAIRETILTGSPDPLPAQPVIVTASPPGSIDLEPIRDALRLVAKRGSIMLARKILDGDPIAEPGGRDATINAAASLVATAAPADTTTEAAVAVLRPSISRMDYEPEGLEFWIAKAANSFERAQNRRLRVDEQHAKDREAMLAILGVKPEPTPNFNGGPPPPPDEEWKNDLIWNRDEEGNPTTLKQCDANVELILRCDARWRDRIKFNEVTKAIDVFDGCPLFGRSPATLDVEATNWLSRSEYKLFPKSHNTGFQLLAVAKRNAFDPLADHLRALKWDGVARVAEFLKRYMGAVGDDGYLATISTKWMVSAIARALNPGCKVDTVLILEGDQGIGKSTALKLLGGAFFTDTKLNIGDKDSRMMAATQWIIELGELASLKKSDADSLKTFFSGADDKVRPPYGRVLELFLRRCIFVGTTNPSGEYLIDPTGNRRYWPVFCTKVDNVGLLQDRDQLWAEAVAIYEAGFACCQPDVKDSSTRCEKHRWWLDAEEAVEAEEQAKERTRTSVKGDLILEWWLRIAPEKRAEHLSTLDVARDGLGLMSAQITDQVKVEIGHAMKELGFSKHRHRQGGKAVWVFKPSESLRTATQASPGKPSFAAIENAKITGIS